MFASLTSRRNKWNVSSECPFKAQYYFWSHDQIKLQSIFALYFRRFYYHEVDTFRESFEKRPPQRTQPWRFSSLKKSVTSSNLLCTGVTFINLLCNRRLLYNSFYPKKSSRDSTKPAIVTLWNQNASRDDDGLIDTAARRRGGGARVGPTMASEPIFYDLRAINYHTRLICPASWL